MFTSFIATGCAIPVDHDFHESPHAASYLRTHRTLSTRIGRATTPDGSDHLPRSAATTAHERYLFFYFFLHPLDVTHAMGTDRDPARGTARQNALPTDWIMLESLRSPQQQQNPPHRSPAAVARNSDPSSIRSMRDGKKEYDVRWASNAT
jgi:hypothetical protein